MGTVANPGLFPCIPDDNEEYFRLLERDRTAADFVDLWAAVREGNHILAITLSGALLARHLPYYAENPTEPEQIDAARVVANNMRASRSSS